MCFAYTYESLILATGFCLKNLKKSNHFSRIFLRTLRKLEVVKSLPSGFHPKANFFHHEDFSNEFKNKPVRVCCSCRYIIYASLVADSRFAFLTSLDKYQYRSGWYGLLRPAAICHHHHPTSEANTHFSKSNLDE